MEGLLCQKMGTCLRGVMKQNAMFIIFRREKEEYYNSNHILIISMSGYYYKYEWLPIGNLSSNHSYL